MEAVRRPFQGVTNIVRFNWHFYIIAVFVVMSLVFVTTRSVGYLSTVCILIAAGLSLSVVLSLVVSTYVYDLSRLYNLPWLSAARSDNNGTMLNVTAGFDETSDILRLKLPSAKVISLDFFDVKKHTEISIRRARKVYPQSEDTLLVSTSALPFDNASIVRVFCIFSIHEIRDVNERIAFLRELRRVLSDKGEVMITEHLRNLPNFLAYNIGFFHFYSQRTWTNAFESSNFQLAATIATTPFVKTFILKKNGASS